MQLDKKKIITLICSCLIFFSLAGYTYPDDSPQILIEWNSKPYTIYFPVGNDNKLKYDDYSHSLINISGSTVTGYFTYNNTEYTITFPTYNTPYFRTGTVQSSYVYLDYVTVEDTENFKLYNRNNQNIDNGLNIIIILLLFFNLMKGGY